MAQFSLVTLVIALAAFQVAFAGYYYCNRPYTPGYGSYWPYKSKYAVGDTVYFRCKGGYSAYGSSSAKCVYNSWHKRAYWSHKPPVCKRITYCPKLKLGYGYVKHTGVYPGSKALHYCNKCYKLVGYRTRICLKNGYWSGKPPVCKIIDCGWPPKPYYGKVWAKSTKCGAKAVHSCNYGYYLKGSKIRVCQKNGYWSGRTPKCIRRKKYYY